jgi:hypothetical protein
VNEIGAIMIIESLILGSIEKECSRPAAFPVTLSVVSVTGTNRSDQFLFGPEIDTAAWDMKAEARDNDTA